MFIDTDVSYITKETIYNSDDLASKALRVTFGDDNTKEDVDYLVQSICESVSRN